MRRRKPNGFKTVLASGQYAGLTLDQAPSAYLRAVKQQLVEDGSDPELLREITEVLRSKGQDFGPGTVHVTTHAINRWTDRVLRIGAVGDELMGQAKRAWEEGTELPAREGAQRRLWRGVVWVFAENSNHVTLLTLFLPDEERKEPTNAGGNGQQRASGVDAGDAGD